MNPLLSILWYQARLSLSWAALLPPLLYSVSILFLAITAPLTQRGHDVSVALEGGLPLVAALLAAPLLMADRERDTLTLLAVRATLLNIFATRLALLLCYLITISILVLLAAQILWPSPGSWEVILYAVAPAMTFVALALLAASSGRSTAHGYLLSIGVWIGSIGAAPLLPRHEPWMALNPMAWAFAYGPDVVIRSKVVYIAAALVLFLPQWILLQRVERLLRPT